MKSQSKKQDELKKLSHTELQFMRFIWTFPEGVSSEIIYANFPQKRGTKSTILYNISEKGYVEKTQQGLHHFYRATVSEETYNQKVLNDELETLFGVSSIERLIAAFCGKRELTAEQYERINKLLQELKDESGSK